MELAHSLTLNEQALAQLPEAKRTLFVFEWLRFVDKVLGAAQKSDVKSCQKQLVSQILAQVGTGPGAPTRVLLGRCLATLFSVGDPFLLFDAVNKCNDILKQKDDSTNTLSTKIAALVCLGFMYEKLGRMMGRSYEETIQILLKSLKNAESLVRCEIMRTLQKVLKGLGTATCAQHKDIFKAAKVCLTDRNNIVRCAAANCLTEMIQCAPFMYTSDFDNMLALCCRAFEGASFEARRCIGNFLGCLLAATQMAGNSSANNGKQNNGSRVHKVVTLDDALGILQTALVRGQSNTGFLGGGGEVKSGGSGTNSSQTAKEIRVGIIHAYVAFITKLGPSFLERNTGLLIKHCLETISNPRLSASVSHVDMVCCRNAVSFLLRTLINRMLNEKARIAACKDLISLTIRFSNFSDGTSDSARDSIKQDLAANVHSDAFGGNIQHALVCSLQELGHLFTTLGTSISVAILNQETATNLSCIEAMLTNALLHPSNAVRSSAAWCIRCLVLAVPQQLTVLLDRCVDRLDSLKNSPEAISGYSAAIAALTAASAQGQLSMPHAKGKIICTIAEDLLRTANQNCRLSLQRTHAGWLLISATCTLGDSVVKGLLPHMLLLWRNCFPRSARDFESEKARGDAFTWQVTLEARSGALNSMRCFLQHCPGLITPDVIRRMLLPIEAALTMLAGLGPVVKQYGVSLKASCATVRLRLYETLALLPPVSIESSYNSLLRLLVSEFTLAESSATLTTSLLRHLCHRDDVNVLLGGTASGTETDCDKLEEQLPPRSVWGALEHDPATILSFTDQVPSPLPLGVAVIDSSVLLFGQIFARVANKHRQQMLEHFVECIKQSKANRQEAVQTNVLAALIAGLKTLAESKTTLSQEDTRNAAKSIISGCLSHSNPVLRCAAGEAIGRLAQAVASSRVVAELAQTSFDKLQSSRDAVSRTGHSLTLGCLHRYIGGMGCGQFLNTSVSILLALAQDVNSPVVQVWSLHALTLIADSVGPMFRSYVEPTLSLSLSLLLGGSSHNNADVIFCIGRLLQALIVIVGPELQANTPSASASRWSFLCACALLQEHVDNPPVLAAATSCLQQLHMFAPRYVNLSTMVPDLITSLTHTHLQLRRAAVSCLRQLSQREARAVWDHAVASEPVVEKSTFTDVLNSLPGRLFGVLDHEDDSRLCSDAKDTVVFMVQALAEDQLPLWIMLCKHILTVASVVDSGFIPDKDVEAEQEPEEDDSSQFHRQMNDDAGGTAGASGRGGQQHAIMRRWTTRVFAAEVLRKVMGVCEKNRSTLDFSFHQDSDDNSKEYGVTYLNDLVRMAFMAATSDSDPLRLEGLLTLQLIIASFAKVPEPEFPGHVILEQYQAQVGAALRPAFSPDTPPHVTAMACQVCSAWISSGVARDLNDLRRVHHLLVSSLAKLDKNASSALLYNENVITMEKLAIMKAWAEVYIVSMNNLTTSKDNANPNDSLLQLVKPELDLLSSNWLAALRDHALLSLSPEYSAQLPRQGGAFYHPDTVDACRKHYAGSWPAILNAVALWLSHNQDDEQPPDTFHLVFGLCVSALCNSTPSSDMSAADITTVCLKSLLTILDSDWTRKQLVADAQLQIELCNVLHRVILTSDSLVVHNLVLDLLVLVINIARSAMDTEKKSRLKEMVPANQEPRLNDTCDVVALLGEGGASGDIIPGTSLVFACLELCLCIMVRRVPALSVILPNSAPAAFRMGGTVSAGQTVLFADLAVKIVSCLEELIHLCSPAGAVAVLPSVLYMIVSVLRHCPVQVATDVCAKALQSIITSIYATDSRSSVQWHKLVQSMLLTIVVQEKPEHFINEKSSLTVVTVFLIHCPERMMSASSNLLANCVKIFTQALDNNNWEMRIHCIENLTAIVRGSGNNRAIPSHLLRYLLPQIVNLLCKDVDEGSTGTSDEHRQLVAKFAGEGILLVEGVLAMQLEPEKRLALMSLFVPILTSLLIDTERFTVRDVGEMSCTVAVHNAALTCLLKIGPLYPQEFKNVIFQCPKPKAKLESAIRELNSRHGGPPEPTAERNTVERNSGTERQFQQQQPAIKLKMDFSNFK